MVIRCSGCFSEYDESFGLCPFCGHIEGETGGEVFCLAPGTVIAGRYVIGKVLGIGGFGITYKAWDNKLNTTMAVKEYYPSGMVNRLPGEVNVILVASKQERAFFYGKTRFLQEARNLARFSTHKSIVNVFEYFEANNTAYIVMEYLEGKTIRETMRDQNCTLPWDYGVSIACDVCSALKALHKEHILHRDVSPDNIMICSNGAVKLLDFGAARFSAEVDSKVSVVVKPGFAPPEQYDKVNKQDGRTDIYALGATLYYAITGIKPDESTNRVIKDEVCDPHTVDSSIPENISNAVMRAMAVEQQYRFANVEAFEAALTGGKKVESVSTRRKKKKAFRIGGWLAGGVAAVLALLVGVFGVGGPVELPAADLELWYVQRGQEELDAGRQQAMESVLAAFTEEHGDITVQAIPVPQAEYADKLRQAFTDNEAPDLFESAGLEEQLLEHAQDLSAQIKKTGSNAHMKAQTDPRAVPTGIVVPMIFVNSGKGTPEDCEDLTAMVEACSRKGEYLIIKEGALPLYVALYGSRAADYVGEAACQEFLDRKAFLYLGDSEDYFDIQSNMPGEYTVIIPGGDEISYRYAEQWSVSAGSTQAERRAAAGLAEYFCSELAQDYFYIQSRSGIFPSVRTSMHNFVSIYSEVEGLEEALDESFVQPPADIDSMIANADKDALIALKNGAAAVFGDVEEGSWYHKAVSRLYACGILQGTTADKFEPNAAITKIDLVQALYQAAGAPEMHNTVFADVTAGTPQAKAAAWSVAQQILDEPENQSFEPDSPVNLESCLTMLYRYAQKNGYDMSITKKIGQFADGAAVSQWAVDGVLWAATHGLFSLGNGGEIAPSTHVTRARFAIILDNLLNN